MGIQFLACVSRLYIFNNFRYFENVFAVNGWNDDDQLLWLKVKIVEKAHMACAFAQLAHETQQSYATAKKVLFDSQASNNCSGFQHRFMPCDGQTKSQSQKSWLQHHLS